MGFRFLACAGAVAATLPVGAAAQGAAGDAERNWAAVAQCASIDAPAQRHQCVDEVLQRSGLLSPQRIAEAARQDFGREERTRPIQRTVSAPAVAERNGTVSVSQPADEMRELMTTIASVRTVGYRRLVVTTAEGTVWQQTQAETFTTTPEPGDPFVIQQAAFNSYRCRFANSSRYRCERVD